MAATTGTVVYSAPVIGNQTLNMTGYTLSVSRTGSFPAGNYRVTKVTITRAFRNTSAYNFSIKTQAGKVIGVNIDAQTGGSTAYTSAVSGWKQADLTGITAITLYGVGGSSGELASGSTVSLTITWQETDVPTEISSGTAAVSIGGTVTIRGTAAYSDYTHTMTVSLGSASVTGTITQSGTGVSGSCVIPARFADQMPDSVSGVGTITLTTFNAAGTRLGSVTKAVRIGVPWEDAYRPTVTVTVEVNDAVTLGGNDYTLQGISSVTVTAAASGAHSSLVKKIEFAGQNLSGSVTGSAATMTAAKTSGVLTASGALTWTVTVTDSRGRSRAVTSSAVTVTAYAKPALTRLSGSRCDPSGNPVVTGTSAAVQTTVSWSALDGANALHLKVESREANAAWPVTAAYDGGFVSPLILAGYAADHRYQLRVTPYDDVSAGDALELDIDTAYVLMRWDPVRSAFGYGCYPTGERRVEIADDWGLYHGGVDVLDAPTLWEDTSPWYTGSQTIADLEDWLIVEAVTDAGPSGLLTNDGTGVFRGVCFGWTYGGFIAYFAAITAGSGVASMGHFEQLSIKPSGISTIGTQCGIIRLIGIKRK